VKEKYIIKECKHHGSTEFILEGRGSYRCKKCRSKAVLERRRVVKKKLVNSFGNKCLICNYSKCIQALEFHHLNPKEKKFALANDGISRSYKKSLEEAKKCIMVCANCHREIESNLVDISDYINK
jgi:5-methylcytosine-specific restriction endonuclease McrA